MERNQVLIIFASSAVILLLLVVGVYFLLNSSSNLVNNGMMWGPFPTTNNNWVIALILIAIAIIIALTLILYFAFTKNDRVKKPKIEPPSTMSYARTKETVPTITENLRTGNLDERPFDVFICYKKSSGKDYADHLKIGLEELGLHAFEDCRDIPQTVDTEEGWACSRDRALEESKYFILIMTPGFNLSREVIKEISMARKIGNKTFVFFRHRSMGRNIVLNLGDEVLDIEKLEQVSFESKEELLRLAHNILLKSKNP